MPPDSSLYIPAAPVQERSVAQFFGNIRVEIAGALSDAAGRRMLATYYREAGLIDRPDKRRFFHHHFVQNVARAAPVVMGDSPMPRVLDLGCGMGTQAILFALLGASVVGLDLDGDALRIAHDRKRLYEEAAGRELDVRFERANALDFPFESEAPFDAVYSLFAFNMMQPSRLLIGRLGAAIRTGGRFVVQDGNRRMWFNRFFRPRDVLDARELHQALIDVGFAPEPAIGLYALPPMAWMLPMLARPVDDALRWSQLLTGSWLHIAYRI